jgi:uncharacterized membrane-anchored protein
MRHLFKLMPALACLFLAMSAPQRAEAKDNAPPPAAQDLARAQEIKAIQDSLHPQTGDIRLPDTNAVLHLGTDYYFLPAEEAKRVLIDAWKNHPDSGIGVLGLVFPKGKTFLDDTWAAVVTFEATGYVGDEDAQSTDYGALMTQMQSGEAEVNARRTQQGFPAQHLVGWAQPPVYDPRSHSVVWARNIDFSDLQENVLNYDVRLLGRSGVLSLNMLTSMSKLAETRVAAARFAKAAEYDSGSRYADFTQGDPKAEYGVAGLVAAGVGVAVAKKIGLIGVILAFGKKFIILIIAAFGALAGGFRKLFGGRSGKEADDYQPAYDEAPAAEAEAAPAMSNEEMLGGLSNPEPNAPR